MQPGRQKRETGSVVLALLAALLLVGIYVMFGSLNLGAVRVDRDRATNEALAKAKQALIAYAVSDPNRPGELPCPDVNDDGVTAFGEDWGVSGSACVSLIGRLPWKTLNIPDLRDDSGERLWYALSADFRAGGSTPLNNDTAYRTGNRSLRLVSGAGLPAMPDGVAVAVIFAPGATLQRSDGVSQVRGCTVGVNCDAALKCTTSPATNTPKCDPKNYLDIALGEDNADLLPAANPQFVLTERSLTFNDRLMAVYSDDIMWLVQRRAGREYAQHLRDHFDAWDSPPAVPNTTFSPSFHGFYPFAAPLTDPTALNAGANGNTDGQLPLNAGSIVWSAASATLGSCSGVKTAQIVCSATSAGGLLTINGTVSNVATAFVDPPSAANVTVSGIIVGPSQTTWTYNAAGQTLGFTWQATLAGIVTVKATVPTASAWTTASWLTDNNWHENALYVLSSGYGFNRNASCGDPKNPCLTVNGNTTTQAVVLMTGRALTPASAPSCTAPKAAPPCVQAQRPLSTPLAPAGNPQYQFLEGSNATAGTVVFQETVKTPSFNDLPIAVR